MEAIFDALNGVWEAIQGIYNSIIGFFGDVSKVGEKLLEIPTTLGNYLSFFPSSLTALLLVIIGILIMYKTAGRS